MNKLTGFIMLVTGAVVGSVVTWKVLRTKYDQILQDEIDSIKEYYKKKNENTELVEEKSELTIGQQLKNVVQDRKEYAKTIEEAGYMDYTQPDEDSEEERIPPEDRLEVTTDIPYVISPEEYGEDERYTQVSLTLYSDAFVADKDGQLIEDVDDIIGMESLTHFGEYEDDSVFVRNEKYHCEYEILLDQRRYTDVISQKPYLVEDQ